MIGIFFGETYREDFSLISLVVLLIFKFTFATLLQFLNTESRMNSKSFIRCYVMKLKAIICAKNGNLASVCKILSMTF